MEKKRKTIIPKLDAYKADGVDGKAGDTFSKFAGEICVDSFNNSKYVEVVDHSKGYFRGPRSFFFKNLSEGIYQTQCSDGVGTKPILNDAADMYGSSGNDLLAMTAMDITRHGGLPLVFSNNFDPKSLGEEGSPANKACRRIIQGLGTAAKRINIVLFRGETAELGVCIGSENPKALVPYNWSGVMTGVVHKNKIIDGKNLKPGQIVMALREFGFRSNGLSAVRKALKLKFGNTWYKNKEALRSITDAAEPSMLYDNFLTDLNGWYSKDFRRKLKVHAIAHITGGGIPGKLGDDILFPRGLSAVLNNLWTPPEIMQNCFDWRGLDKTVTWDDRTAYKTWNGGQGALVVIDAKDEQRFINFASGYNMLEVKKAGRITESKGTPSIRLKSGYTGVHIIFEKES